MQIGGTMRINLSLLLFISAAFFGCNQVESSADDVNRPGLWHLTFVRLQDVLGSPSVIEEPAPEYPARVLRSPVPDHSTCSPGCNCAFQHAMDVCEGDITEHCFASGGFVETCSDAHTILDCGHMQFDSNKHTSGVCLLADSSRTDGFGYITLGRYKITFDRESYE
jgi:hypothetical protein